MGLGRAMAVPFISHSSKDDTKANALEAWLKASGFTDLFIDHEQSSPAATNGERRCARRKRVPRGRMPGHGELARFR